MVCRSTCPPGRCWRSLVPTARAKPPPSAWARIAGYDVVAQPEAVRGHVGVLTEQHGLYERMKALEYLDFFGQVYRLSAEERKRRALGLMERFGLTFALE